MARAPHPPRPPTPALLARAAKVTAALATAYPDAKCSLDYATPLQLLIATILSAQCTDARVNQVTPALFQRFPTAKAIATAPAGELERMIQSTGFFRNKARALREVCAALNAHHAGEVPRALEELTALRGIGRKTANVVLGNAYGLPGIVVDTHVIRVSQRLGFTKQKDPEKIEQNLMALLPKEDWVVFGHRMIYHGRRHCKAPTPQCFGCPLLKVCPYPKKNLRPAREGSA